MVSSEVGKPDNNARKLRAASLSKDNVQTGNTFTNDSECNAENLKGKADKNNGIEVHSDAIDDDDNQNIEIDDNDINDNDDCDKNVFNSDVDNCDDKDIKVVDADNIHVEGDEGTGRYCKSDLDHLNIGDAEGPEIPYNPDIESVRSSGELSGSPNECFLTERWLRILLWTVHMYIDGFCTDFMFSYERPCAPHSQEVKKYIENFNVAPFVLQAPVSNTSAFRLHALIRSLLPQSASNLPSVSLQNILDLINVARPNHCAKDSVNDEDVFSVGSNP